MRARILPPLPKNIEIAARAIQAGEVVGMPTETVYGLAADCRSPAALARVFDTKERPVFDPLIIHVGLKAKSLKDLEDLHLVDGAHLSNQVRLRIDHLIRKFWPGPLTLVLPKHRDVPDLATSGLPTVGLRMPKHPVAQALIAESQCPLAAPSANRFGRISPTTAEAVAEELGDRIQWILEGGPSEIGLESTVISFSARGDISILRPGGTPQEKIEEVVGETVFLQSQALPSVKEQPAPGMLESHYAPEKPFHVLPKRVPDLRPEDLDSWEGILKGSTVGLLVMKGNPEPLANQFSQLTGRPVLARTLSLSGDLSEAARNLFYEMRWLDSSEATVIFTEPSPSNQGLGYAISDRLKRASTPPTR